MSHAGHFKRVCSCGQVLAQCRCMDPAKAVEVVRNGCPSCVNKLIRGSDGYEVRVKTEVVLPPVVVISDPDPKP